MGGPAGDHGRAFFVPGNTTALAEFNFFADPEAAAAVARSEMRSVWVPLDATPETGITHAQWERLADSEDDGHVLVREVIRRSLTELNRPRFHLHDPLAVAVAESEAAVEVMVGRVVVDVGEFERGKTHLTEPVGSEAATNVARHVNHDAFGAILERLAPVST